MMSADLIPYVRHEANDRQALDLKIGGMKCAACLAKVQAALSAPEGAEAHVDLASGRASLRWQGEPTLANDIVQKVESLGYQVEPWGEEPAAEAQDISSLRNSMIAAGLSTAIVMMLGMMPSPPVWVMAGVTVLCLLYSGRPFFKSSWAALRAGQSNMDVPIALALVLTTGLSLFEIAHQGTYTYFDSVVMLIFVLLIGRYLDEKARGRARSAAEGLLALFSGSAKILEGEAQKEMPIRDLRAGMILIVAAGEKIAADGEVTQGLSEVDPSIITGETVSEAVGPGSRVFGGMINLSAPIRVRITAAPGESLVSEVIRLMEKAQQSQAKFVRLADRVARLYMPIVFVLAALTFLGWYWLAGQGWPHALLVTSTVLIITCPCAMGLAVPVVQVLASSRLFRRGLLVKSADALERLAKVDTVVFDKTGTITSGLAKLANRADITTDDLKLAASLAVQSRHPLAQAVLRAHGEGPIYALEVSEYPGQGLEAEWNGDIIRLGRREWCGPSGASHDERPEMWLRKGYKPALRLAFVDAPREDAAAILYALKRRGLDLYMFSGDREAVVAEIAQQVGLEDGARAHMSPPEKSEAIEALRAQGKTVLMVGDGLNDAAALAGADVSISPSSALDITQSAADIVFQGAKLAPVLEALEVAHKAQKLVKENIALAVLYNVIAVPLAMAGLASPPVAAAAMSLSSITVVLNALRVRK